MNSVSKSFEKKKLNRLPTFKKKKVTTKVSRLYLSPSIIDEDSLPKINTKKLKRGYSLQKDNSRDRKNFKFNSFDYRRFATVSYERNSKSVLSGRNCYKNPRVDRMLSYIDSEIEAKQKFQQDKGSGEHYELYRLKKAIDFVFLRVREGSCSEIYTWELTNELFCMELTDDYKTLNSIISGIKNNNINDKLAKKEVYEIFAKPKVIELLEKVKNLELRSSISIYEAQTKFYQKDSFDFYISKLKLIWNSLEKKKGCCSRETVCGKLKELGLFSELSNLLKKLTCSLYYEDFLLIFKKSLLRALFLQVAPNYVKNKRISQATVKTVDLMNSKNLIKLLKL